MATQVDIYNQARQIKLLAMDVDGVLTNGEIIYTDDGQELKIFNVKDGHGISMLIHSGIDVALITGRNSTITKKRADELGIRHVFQNVKDKMPVMEKLASNLGLQLVNIAYMGDDTPDIPVMKMVGLAFCPSDAVAEVKRVSHYTTQVPGGRGAVREIIDLIMSARSSASDIFYVDNIC